MYSNILLAADGSENALRAAKEAIKIASCHTGCSIEIIYVADFSKSKNEILHSQGTEELEFSRRKKIAIIENEIKNNNINYSVRILHGEPGPSIIDYANEGNSDLLVIGSRGLNAFQEMVLGSVSHKVVKRANCPVLIVK